MDEVLLFIGFAVGMAVGMTGMGGGSLMTPVLILLGVQPSVAVGTDLIYASLTKFTATLFHHRKRNISRNLIQLMIPASLGGAIGGWYLLKMLEDHYGIEAVNTLILIAVGGILAIVSIIMVLSALKRFLRTECEICEISCSKYKMDSTDKWKILGMAFLVGIAVQLSSVGSGVLLGFALLATTRIHPRLIVGSDIVIGLLLTAAGGLLHYQLGNVDILMALKLFTGSIFGVYIGTSLNSRINANTLRTVLSTTIFFSAVITLGKVFLY
jgi:hypothetical protein